MDKVRLPAVAGLFYPKDQRELSASIDSFLKDQKVSISSKGGFHPKALIVPHAGYIYSGAVAGTAYSQILNRRDEIKKVILVGPAHRLGIRGIALPDVSTFLTPLGKVLVDPTLVEKVRVYPWVEICNEAHLDEHSLEVHLPFLQKILGDFKILPLLVGRISPEDVGETLRSVWGGPETLIVISSDLSHYLEYDAAKEIDESTSRSILEGRWKDLLDGDRACGAIAIAGLLRIAHEMNLKSQVLDLRNSGDTAGLGPLGRKSQVVGYGAYGFYEHDTNPC